ncbi:TetR/AcrR family transcriptional regulator [Mycobacterium asiaticum]|uniref:TetR family transcriptional regulator n=1 Tax=Mycobacterium asiaticum TaxID=1790 RepID=A0A1A3NDB1_MYCAS|nr:TetR/AcrR family transcriptional regulator [Mycobacterium asiaticum]OBK19280.1 TetR family transcriptional regulator [Mycobacterium asiaticum]
MTIRRPSSNSRLSVDDWLQAGYAIVAEEGLTALKLDRLCARLGVTKGSFYWHFADMPAYRQALIESWAQLRDEDRSEIERMRDLEPRERLSRMMAALVRPRHWSLERAIREWARSDDSVAAAVRTADRRLLKAVRQAFSDFGFDAAEADLRANATFAAGVGLLHLSGPTPNKQALQRERFLDFLLRP